MGMRKSTNARPLEKPESAVNKRWSDITWTGIDVVLNVRGSVSTNGLSYDFPIRARLRAG
jgi:hypothetical protein